MLRAVLLGCCGLLSLVVVLAAGAWVALPWLVGPTGPAPVATPDWSATRLAADVGPGPGGAETLRLGQADADGLLALWTAGAAGTISAATATFVSGRVDLRVRGEAPQAMPLARLRGLPFEVDAEFTPTVRSPGVLDLTLDRLQIGRLPITDFVPPGSLLQAVAGRMSAPHSAWRVTGDTLHIDLSSAPPLALGQFGLRMVPTALTVSPGALVVTLDADALLVLDATTLETALSQLLLAQNAGSIPILDFQPGVVFLKLLSGGGDSPIGVQRWTLIPSIPQTGTLRLAVSGASAEDAAGLLETAIGRTPPWLRVQSQEIDIDFSRVAPITVAPGIRLTFLPTAVTVDPVGVHATARIALAPAA